MQTTPVHGRRTGGGGGGDAAMTTPPPTTGGTAAKRPVATPNSSMLKPLSMEKEISEHRRRKAAEQLRKSLAHHMEQPAGEQPAYSAAQMKQLFEAALKLASDNKITEKNAFDLAFIDVLPELVQQPRRHDHFQKAGMGLDIGTKIFAKRVDAIAKEAFRSLGCKLPTDEDDEQDQDGKSKGEIGDDDEQDGDAEGRDAPAADARKAKAGRRRAAQDADPSATLADPEKLRQSAVEPSFDSDPFFVRTARLFDDNSAQSLLLHNLQVKGTCSVMFDAADSLDVAPAQRPSDATKSGDVMIDLTVLPSARELLAAAARGTITPSIGQLYAQLQPAARPLPGLAAAEALDLAAIVREAQGQEQAAAAAHGRARHAVMRQVVAEVAEEVTTMAGGSASNMAGSDARGGFEPMDMEDGDSADGGDAMDVDDGGDDSQRQQAAHSQSQQQHSATGARPPQGGEGSYGGDEDEGGGSGQYGGGADSDDGGGYYAESGIGGGCGATLDSDAEDGGGASAYDDGGAGGAGLDPEYLRTLLGEGASRAGPNSLLAKGNAWAGPAFFRPGAAPAKKGKGATAAATRLKKAAAKQQGALIDFLTAQPAEPRLVELREVCYKRRRPKVDVLLPPDQNVQESDLLRLFCRPGGDVRDIWRALLLSERNQQRKAAANKAAAAAAAAVQRGGTHLHSPPAGWRGEEDFEEGSGMQADGPSPSGVGYGGDGGEDFGGGGDYGAGSDDDEELGQDPALMSLEDLLAPPRRVKRVAINYARSAKVVDVRSLKENLLSSLVSLVPTAAPPGHGTAAQQQQQQPPSDPCLPFQSLLDELPRAAAKAAAGGGGGGGGGKHGGGGGQAAAAYELADVSVHLGFICLLHLANEHGLSLSNAGRLDTLRVAGLAGLSAAQPGAV